MQLKPCKYLDYEVDKYGPDIELCDCSPHYPDVRYWHRGERWTDNGPGEKPSQANVQFCGKWHGRINSIFDCYTGNMSCYEPETP